MSLANVSLAATGGNDAAFYAVFGVFLAAFLVLAVITLRWAVRRDRVGRAEWVRRRSAAKPAAEADGPAPKNGRVPGTGARG